MKDTTKFLHNYSRGRKTIGKGMTFQVEQTGDKEVLEHKTPGLIENCRFLKG